MQKLVSGLTLKTGLLMQVKLIVITPGRIRRSSLNTDGLLIQVVFRSGSTVYSLISTVYSLTSIMTLISNMFKRFFKGIRHGFCVFISNQ